MHAGFKYYFYGSNRFNLVKALDFLIFFVYLRISLATDASRRVLVEHSRIATTASSIFGNVAIVLVEY